MTGRAGKTMRAAIMTERGVLLPQETKIPRITGDNQIVIRS